MIRLFSVIGLIAAFIFNSFGVYASIYDVAEGFAPSTDPKELGVCDSNYGPTLADYEEPACAAYIKSRILAAAPPIWQIGELITEVSRPSGGLTHTYYLQVFNTAGGRVLAGRWLRRKFEPNISCPPKSHPDHVYSHDSNNDGVPDKCYNPLILDQLSNCGKPANLGQLMPDNGSGAPHVCVTFFDGSRCAFSRVSQGLNTYYEPNLEKTCFQEPLPDYNKPNPDPTMPDDNQCQKYGSGFVCSADPKNYCSADGICLDGCGYVNNQFVCFRDESCTGASCEPAPVDCTTSPEAPICKDKENTPEPSFCEKNPMVAGCQEGSDFCKANPTAPSCLLGGGGGGGGGGSGEKFSLDYAKLIEGMKEASSLLIDESDLPEFAPFVDEVGVFGEATLKHIETVKEDSVFSEWKDSITAPIFSSLESIFPSGGGGQCGFVFLDVTLDICEPASRVREILYFVFSVLTALYLRHLFYSTLRS